MIPQAPRLKLIKNNISEDKPVFVKVLENCSAKILRTDLAATIYHCADCPELKSFQIKQIDLIDAAYWKLARCTSCSPPSYWLLLAC